MKGSSFKYLVKQGIVNVWLNRLMSFASIGILTACFILVGGAMLLSLNIRDLFVAVESQNEMVVYIEEAAIPNAEAILSEIEDINGVASTRYVSKAEALEEQKLWLGDDASLLEGLEGDNPLPASIRVTLTDLGMLGEVEARCSGIAGVESISSPTYLAETITGLERVLLFLGIVIIGLLLVTSLVVIGNTVRLTVFSRRREINIMKYVGATNTFIRLPFIVEGMVIGLVAAVLAFGVLFGVYFMIGRLLSDSIIPWVSTISGGLIPFGEVWLFFAIGFLAAGFLIGAFGSWTPVKKYLRV